MNKIIICADDFAQNDAISHGIIKLIENNRLSATSCMTNLESWPEHSLLLKKITTIDMGVHLNFTHGKPLSKALQKQFKSWPNSILSIIKLIISKQLTLTKLENEIELQLNNFEKYINKIPDFIDGHQHLHHFPVIRQALLKVYLKKYGMLDQSQKPYIRISSCNAKINEQFCLKKKIIQLTGSEKLQKQLIKHQIPFNQNFAGIYPFNKKYSFDEICSKILEHTKNTTLLMCHPAFKSNDASDPIAYFRYKELEYLISDKFKQLLIKNNIQIARFKQS